MIGPLRSRWVASRRELNLIIGGYSSDTDPRVIPPLLSPEVELSGHRQLHGRRDAAERHIRTLVVVRP